jgi:hypothetical protein
VRAFAYTAWSSLLGANFALQTWVRGSRLGTRPLWAFDLLAFDRRNLRRYPLAKPPSIPVSAQVMHGRCAAVTDLIS